MKLIFIIKKAQNIQYINRIFICELQISNTKPKLKLILTNNKTFIYKNSLNFMAYLIILIRLESEKILI
jgi:hypothetical protein